MELGGVIDGYCDEATKWIDVGEGRLGRWLFIGGGSGGRGRGR